jgi:hypothetical protein
MFNATESGTRAFFSTIRRHFTAVVLQMGDKFLDKVLQYHSITSNTFFPGYVNRPGGDEISWMMKFARPGRKAAFWQWWI